MTIDDEFSYEIHNLNTMNNNQSKEIYIIKDSYGLVDKFNQFFWDNFSDYYKNDKIIHSRALHEDKVTSRRIYNVVKNVDMFKPHYLDDNTLIDKNTFEVPVFNEIIEN